MGYSAPAFGLLSTGFVKKLTSDVFLDIQTQTRANVDPNFDTSPTEPIGQTLGIVSGSIAECWEVLETVYNAIDPDAAEGPLLYGIGAITGTNLIGATNSTCQVSVTMGSSATINAGLVGSVTSQPTNQWQLLGACDANGNITGPLTSTSAGVYNSLWKSTTTGPNVANAGTLVVVATPPSGFVSMTNPNDAIIGTNQETDAEFRVRRNAELAASGQDTLDAIRAAVLQVAGVVSCVVYQNDTDYVDATGRAPHSVEVVLFDGNTPTASNNAIAQAMFDNQVAGIPYYSATGDGGFATDSVGNQHALNFSRVVVTPFWVTLTTTPPLPTAAVKASLAATALSLLQPGSTAYRLQLMASILPDGPNPVALAEDVTIFLMDTHSTPTDTANIPATVRQQLYLPTTNITVSNGT